MPTTLLLNDLAAHFEERSKNEEISVHFLVANALDHWRSIWYQNVSKDYVVEVVLSALRQGVTSYANQDQNGLMMQLFEELTSCASIETIEELLATFDFLK